jgi:hypothetical protein
MTFQPKRLDEPLSSHQFHSWYAVDVAQYHGFLNWYILVYDMKDLGFDYTMGYKEYLRYCLLRNSPLFKAMA